MSKIKIDTIQTKSQLNLLNHTETSEINGGLVNVNVGVIVDPDVIVNPQVSLGIGGGSASNSSGNGIFSGNGLGQFNF